MNDTIYRQAAIDTALRAISDLQAKDPLRDEYIISEMEELPSAVRHGRWEDVEHAPNGLLYVTCSVCGKRQTVEATNYCGNCGARMKRVENE